MEDHGTPAHVIGHCKAVAHVSIVVGKALNAKGFHLDIDLMRAAGLLHDIERTEQNHDEAGATLLHGLGLDEEAAIVRVHMRYPAFNPMEQVTETDIVCLGDRVCRNNQYVGLDARMDYILEKFKDNPQASKVIKANILINKTFIAGLEQALGIGLDALMATNPLDEKGYRVVGGEEVGWEQPADMPSDKILLR